MLKQKNGKMAVVGFIVLLIVYISEAQQPPRYFVEHPGECPPPRTTSVCVTQCRGDHQCVVGTKCCPTKCGGSSCAMPFASSSSNAIQKPGQCPATASGPWVCTSRCAKDSDCRRNFKCCENRCGALACTPPEF